MLFIAKWGGSPHVTLELLGILCVRNMLLNKQTVDVSLIRDIMVLMWLHYDVANKIAQPTYSPKYVNSQGPQRDDFYTKCLFFVKRKLPFPFQSSWSLVPRNPGNGMAPNSWQPIAWTNDYPVHWCIVRCSSIFLWWEIHFSMKQTFKNNERNCWVTQCGWTW